MKRVAIHLAEQQLAKLKVLSNATGLSVAEHVRRAIDDYLSKKQSGFTHKRADG